MACEFGVLRFALTRSFGIDPPRFFTTAHPPEKQMTGEEREEREEIVFRSIGGERQAPALQPVLSLFD